MQDNGRLQQAENVRGAVHDQVEVGSDALHGIEELVDIDESLSVMGVVW